jgi:hypothetical protein
MRCIALPGISKRCQTSFRQADRPIDRNLTAQSFDLPGSNVCQILRRLNTLFRPELKVARKFVSDNFDYNPWNSPLRMHDAASEASTEGESQTECGTSPVVTFSSAKPRHQRTFT